ncbi:MAG: hypothetical protein HYU66_01990, partial [Armatimonadetes bacterium]|nr:hypothetical protein [Armatimonadota bacterium]
GTSRGDIEIHSEVQDWGQLVELVRDRIGQAPDDAGKRPTIERERLAEWLGGERLIVKALGGDAGGSAFLAGCAGVVALIAVLVFLLDTVRFGAVMAMFASIFGWKAWSMSAEDLRRIEATPDGVDLAYARGRRRIGWHEVLGIRADGNPYLPQWVVSTTVGDVAFEQAASGAPQLASAISQVLAARQSGEVLPRMNDVSAAAISPVTAAVSAERGVSRAEGEGDGP